MSDDANDPSKAVQHAHSIYSCPLAQRAHPAPQDEVIEDEAKLVAYWAKFGIPPRTPGLRNKHGERIMSDNEKRLFLSSIAPAAKERA
jgi:hypothetical protein